MEQIARNYLKYKICVSGAARTDFCAPDAMDKTKELGREIVRQNGIVLTGATTGAPYWAVIGAKEEGGIPSVFRRRPRRPRMLKPTTCQSIIMI